MSGLTTRLSLYLPGGGLSGTILPDETADIDKINDNMKKLDAAIGAFNCTSGTRPASPFDGQMIYETDTQKILVYRAATTTWQDQAIYTYGRNFKPADYTAFQALAPNPSLTVGDIVQVITSPTGILRFFWQFQQGGPIFVPMSTIQASSKANMDAFIATVAGLSRLSFQPGAYWYDNSTGYLYQFTSSAGAYYQLTGARSVFTRAATALASGTVGVAQAMGGGVIGSGAFSHAAGVFTCNAAGTYKITLSLNFQANATGTRTAVLLHSDATVRQLQLMTVGATDETLVIVWIKAFTVGQTVTVQGQQNSGGALNTQGEIEFERII